MRSSLLLNLMSFPAWLGVIQVVTPSSASADVTGRTIAMASVLGALTVLVYRLGVWRQAMENTRDSVGADVRAHRDESTASFARLDRRLEAIDHMIALSQERRVSTARWQERTVRRLDALERTVLAEQS